MIRSPRNPLDVSTYRPNTKCIWTITAAANNMRGAFYIPRLQLDAPTGNCGPLAEDRIAIRKNTGDRDYVYLCGEKGERSLVYTMQHQSTLEFTADFESKSDGFLGLFFEYGKLLSSHAYQLLHTNVSIYSALQILILPIIVTQTRIMMNQHW